MKKTISIANDTLFELVVEKNSKNLRKKCETGTSGFKILFLAYLVTRLLFEISRLAISKLIQFLELFSVWQFLACFAIAWEWGARELLSATSALRQNLKNRSPLFCVYSLYEKILNNIIYMVKVKPHILTKLWRLKKSLSIRNTLKMLSCCHSYSIPKPKGTIIFTTLRTEVFSMIFTYLLTKCLIKIADLRPKINI